MKAIAIDANVFGQKAAWDVRRLTALLNDATAAGIELWLSEVVAWELAAKVGDRFVEGRDHLATLNRALSRAGLSDVRLPYQDRQSVQDAVLAGVDASGVVLLPTSPEDTLEGLRDQVLLSSPGRRKDGVKTGAADSAWVRSVVREAKRIDGELVVVSADADVDNALHRFATQNVSLALTWREARDVLFEYESSDQAAADLVVALVHAAEDDALRELLPFEPLRDRGVAEYLEEAWGPLIEPTMLDIEIDRVSALAGLRDVKANSRGGVYARAVFTVDLIVTAWFLDENGELVSDWSSVHDASVVAPMFAALEGGGLSFATLEDVATLRPPGSSWDDEDEALAECLLSLHDVPALANSGVDFSALAYAEDDVAVEVALADTVLALDITGGGGGGWQVRASARSHEIELVCSYDDSTWVGGADGFNIEPPWSVSVEGDTPIRANPAVALGAFAIHQAVAPAGLDGRGRRPAD